MANKIDVEVVYAPPDKQWQYTIQVEPQSTVQDVIHASGLLQQCPELQLTPMIAGIWGKRVELTHPVSPHDRIEIYRSLQIDPKKARLVKARNLK